MIEPPPFAAMRGAIAAVRKNGAFTLTSNVTSNASSAVCSVGPPASDTRVVHQHVDLARGLGEASYILEAR